MKLDATPGIYSFVWDDAKVRLRLADRSNLEYFVMAIEAFGDVIGVKLRIILVGSALVAQVDQYHDIDLIVVPETLPQQNRQFSNSLWAFISSYAQGAGRWMISGFEFEGDCYSNKEACRLKMRGGAPLHVLTLHPYRRSAQDHVPITFDEFLVAEERMAAREARFFSVFRGYTLNPRPYGEDGRQDPKAPGGERSLLAAIFPGEGSQFLGMGKDFFRRETLKPVHHLISEAVGFDVERVCLESDDEILSLTENAQIALYTSGILAYRAFVEATGTEAKVFAGHSDGEYTALAAGGVISLEDGARLLKLRGELMATLGLHRSGAMSAVLGIEKAELNRLCATAKRGSVVIANDNCPGQLVISGDSAAVAEVGLAAKAAGAKRILSLNVSGAFNSPLMSPAKSRMRARLDDVRYGQGVGITYSNVLGTTNDDPEAWPELLEAQLSSSVRWTETVQTMAQSGVAGAVEFGAGDFLCQLIQRNTPEIPTVSVTDDAGLELAKELVTSA